MSSASFDINAIGEDTGKILSADLFLELSEGCLTALWYQQETQAFFRLVQYPLGKGKENPLKDQLRDIIHAEPWFRETVKTVNLVYNTGHAQLVPGHMTDPEAQKAVLDLLLGQTPAERFFSETDTSHQTIVLYRIPQELQDYFESVFPEGTRWHSYVLQLRKLTAGGNTGTCFQLNFCSNKFTLCVTQNGKLLLLQDVPFEQPEDISWFLLGFTTRSGFEREEVRLVVGGLIDSNSVLYQELEKYFLQVELQSLPDVFSGVPALQAYPAHYFSPLLNLALCV